MKRFAWNQNCSKVFGFRKARPKYSRVFLGVSDIASTRGVLASELLGLFLFLCFVTILPDREGSEGYVILCIRACLLVWASMLFSCTRSFWSSLGWQVYVTAQ
jgi:hypothetical protein